MQKFIRLFSFIFHPLFIPVYATLFYFFIAGNYYHQYEVYLLFVQVLILTVLLPVSLFYLLRSLGLIKSKLILSRKERRIPLVFYALLLFILLKQSFTDLVIPELYYFFLGLLISVLIILTLVILGFKPSIHMMYIAALTILIIGISVYYHTRFINLIAFMVLCCGFTASSRLQARAHSLPELLLGTLLGILPQVVLWFIWMF
ncbi:hypothetical protein [Flavobacterium rhizosphaerae]|uniref:PAP2 superfamily protein n=1 Tax=Flavobacterium rhizosphaerae TaxID=3163298 RepID=A0ABW8YX71_9FLAO